MTRDEVKRVQRWLYSIRAKEVAIDNIQTSLERLETRRQSMPTVVQQLSPTAGCGSGEPESQPEKWVVFDEHYESRIELYRVRLEDYQHEIAQYISSLEELSKDEKWGDLAARIIHSKYYRQQSPDERIFNSLACSRNTFYIAHRIGLEFFFRAIPLVW